MQTRTLTASALLAVGIAACSPDREITKSQTSTARHNQELALSASPENSAVVSPIEVARPGTEQKAPRKTLASRKNATQRAVEVAMELPNVDTRIQQTPATVSAAPAVTDIPMMELPASGPSAGTEEVASGGGGNRPEPGHGLPGIIIRGGGRGDGRDPCDLHDGMGGRGNTPPVLVNPRIPGVSLPGAGGGLPTARRGGGGVPTGPSRGGGGGGIRF